MGFNFGSQESKGQQTSSSQATSSSTPTDLTPDAFKGMQPGLASTIMKWLGGGTTPTGGGFGGGGASGDWAQYGTQHLTVPETANEQAIRQLLMGDLDGPRQQLIADTQSGRYTDPNTNPFLKDYITAAQRTTLDNLNHTIERVLPSAFTKAGQLVQMGTNAVGELTGGSSAFTRAAGDAVSSAAQAIGDIATNISFPAYQAERGLQMASIQAGQQETQTTIANLVAQGLPREIQKYGVEKGLELFKIQLAGILDALKTAGALASPTIAQNAQSQSSSKSQGTQNSSGQQYGINLNPTAPGVG